MTRPPAARAALVQLCCLIPSVLLAWAAARAGLAVSLAAAAVLQGALAALVSWRLRLPRWWLPIQFAFPVLLLGAHALALAPGWWLGGFLFLLALFRATWRTRVPYFPSARPVWEAVERLLPAHAGASMVDIGSGMGGLALHVAARRPDVRVLGIEIAPLPWLASVLRPAGAGARFRLGDYARLDLGQFDLVFAYLSPQAMPALWDKARAEMRAGAVLASYEFDVPGMPPDRVELPHEGGAPLFIWVVKK